MVGIIILNYRTWEISLRCMKNIAETQRKTDYKIYLIDNASPNPMPENVKMYLQEYKDSVVFIQAKENRGYAAGNNMGIIQALEDNCESLLITNNDILFEVEAIQELVEALEVERKIGIAGPKVIDDKGNIQVSRCSMKTGMREIFQLFTVAKKLFRKKWNRYYCLNQDSEQPMYVYYVSGCCFAMSRQCALAVTPLDEGTVLYNEELILGIKMQEQGFKTYYNPKSVVVHQHGGTTNQLQPFMHQCISQSELYYCSKYLHAKKWQLWILYHYRRCLYLMRCLKNSSLRGYWRNFEEETRKAYRMALSEKKKKM